MIPAFRRDPPDDPPGPIRRVSLNQFSLGRVTKGRVARLRERLLRYILKNERRRIGARRGLSMDGGRDS